MVICCRPGVSNSIYLGAAGGRFWVRLGRIKFSTKKYKYPVFSSFTINSSVTWMLFCTATFSVHIRHVGMPLCSTKKYSVSHFSWNSLCSSLTFLFTAGFEKDMTGAGEQDIFSFHFVSLRNHVSTKRLMLLIRVSKLDNKPLRKGSQPFHSKKYIYIKPRALYIYFL